MMREISFRAWDTENGWMIYMNDGIPDNDLLIASALSGQSQLIPMQYTGLKDKNGIEIYEGDILTSADTAPSSLRCGRAMEIVWNNEWARFGRARGHAYGISTKTVDRSHLVVIGNIYENKDLLK